MLFVAFIILRMLWNFIRIPWRTFSVCSIIELEGITCETWGSKEVWEVQRAVLATLASATVTFSWRSRSLFCAFCSRFFGASEVEVHANRPPWNQIFQKISHFTAPQSRFPRPPRNLLHIALNLTFLNANDNLKTTSIWFVKCWFSLFEEKYFK